MEREDWSVVERTFDTAYSAADDRARGHASVIGYEPIRDGVEGERFGCKISMAAVEHLPVSAILDGVKQEASYWARIDGDVFVSVLAERTDPQLLPELPPIPDGRLFSETTATGTPRFGADGGNVVKGSGSAPASLGSDLVRALDRVCQFQRTDGTRFVPDEDLSEAMLVFPVELYAGFMQSFNAGLSGMYRVPVRCRLWPDQRLKGKDWFVILPGASKKLLTVSVGHDATGRMRADEKGPSLVVWTRRSYTVNEPFMAIKVING